MKKNRLRVFMTILATTMACAFLIVLASVGFGLQKSMVDGIKEHQIITEVSVHGREEDGNVVQIKEEHLQDFAETDNVTAVVRRNFVQASVDVNFQDRNGYAFPIITKMEEELKANLSLAKGDIPSSENEVIVGYHFAKNLWTNAEREKYDRDMEASKEIIEEPKGFEGELVGQEITMTITKDVDGKQVEKAYTFKISGVAKQPSRDWLFDENIYIDEKLKTEILTFTADVEEFDPTNIPYDEVLVYTKDLQTVAQVTEDLKEKDYHVYSVTEDIDNMNLYFNLFKAGLIFVGTVAVLIASIGIFNTMTMAVTERTQEIGIMKALGAQPGIIRRVFLMESAYIGIVGSVIGVAISYAISLAANKLIPLILSTASDDMGEVNVTFSYIPISLVVIAVAISLGVAIISGVRPAVKATNINVLSALRREL
ncbi:acetoin utilization transport system permease protein [Metabacillus malikii]|uniref:Acetoin utilization transport system permease protein n=2 Tax=Metabacillus malikii TaxID=1504265 RepID=A0ABT9ZFW6_9BACI|nr:acetoin utilization transport system permease protein [Metabacillus malikii]